MTLYSETYKIFLTVFAEQEAAKNFVAYDTGEVCIAILHINIFLHIIILL